jgi:hypothetical protein
LGSVDITKKKKLPHNMEVRFIEFQKLPKLYCRLGGVKYEEQSIEPIMAMAEKIKEVVMTMPKDAEEMSRGIYREVKGRL